MKSATTPHGPSVVTPLSRAITQAQEDQTRQSDPSQAQQAQDAHRVVGQHRPDHALQEDAPIANDAQLGTSDALAVGDGNLSDLDALVQARACSSPGSGSNHRAADRSVPGSPRLKTRIPLALSVTFWRPSRVSSVAKKKLPTRRVSGILLSSPAMREPITRSVPFRAARHSCGKILGRIGPVRIQETDQLTARLGETRLERRAIALVSGWRIKRHTGNVRCHFSGSVLGAIVHDQQLQLVDSNLLQIGSHMKVRGWRFQRSHVLRYRPE